MIHKLHLIFYMAVNELILHFSLQIIYKSKAYINNEQYNLTHFISRSELISFQCNTFVRDLKGLTLLGSPMSTQSATLLRPRRIKEGD